MVQECLNGRMEKYMKVNLKNHNLMEEEQLSIQMGKLLRVNGKKTTINLYQHL